MYLSSRFIFLFLFACLAPWPSLASPGASGSSKGLPPIEEMRITVNKLVEIVEAYPEDENTTLRREKLREAIEPKFDFAEMAKRSLGAHWLKISPAEQESFVKAFSELLASTYLSRIENVRSNMVSVDSEKVKLPKALVKTTVTYKGDQFPIDYKLIHQDSSWKVYDVIIENIGLISNYRGEFSGIIRKEKFSGLLKRLEEKAAAISGSES